MPMIWRLTVTFYSDKTHAPIVVQVGIPEELARALQSQKLTSLGAKLEMAPNYASDIPLLGAKGDGIKL